MSNVSTLKTGNMPKCGFRPTDAKYRHSLEGSDGNNGRPKKPLRIVANGIVSSLLPMGRLERERPIETGPSW